MDWHQVFQIAAVWIVSSFGLVGLWCLWCYWRNLFRRAERNLADFVAGKSPIAHGPDGKFYNPKQAAMNAQLAAENAARKAALEHAVGMK